MLCKHAKPMKEPVQTLALARFVRLNGEEKTRKSAAAVAYFIVRCGRRITPRRVREVPEDPQEALEGDNPPFVFHAPGQKHIERVHI